MNRECATLPGQLKGWDATAIRSFMECPRKFQLSMLQGWDKIGNLDIEFGRIYHEACEMFDKLRLVGWEQEAASWEVFKRFFFETQGALETTYLPVWRCLDPAQVPQIKDPTKLTANRKRCEYAKTDQFDGHRQGECCPGCGGATCDDWVVIAPNRNKNRDTLLRTILHYCDTADDRVQPWRFPDGTPAVELSFRLPLPLTSPDGDPYLLCGNMDGMIEFAGEIVPRERKTTKNTPGLYFFDKYAPDVQIDTYDLAAWVLYSDLLDPKPHGVMVEVTQVTPNFTKIERQIVTVPEERREEWMRDLTYWIKQAEACAKENYWPKNEASCGMNGGCPFREVCRMAPSSRKRFMPGERFVKREVLWNPLDVR
jgi:hypothetical protein